MGDNGKRAQFSKIIRLRISPAQYADLIRIARAHQTSVSAVARMSINDFIFNFNRNFRATQNLLEGESATSEHNIP